MPPQLQNIYFCHLLSKPKKYTLTPCSEFRHAKLLQESLLEIYNRIEAVKEEHDKLDSNNKFLQKYIGDLMSTSKITATGSGNRKK